MNTETTKECWSDNNEDFDHDSLGDLLDCNDELAVGDIVYVADAIPPKTEHLIDADDIIETMGERAYDIAGEYGEDYPDVTQEAKDAINDFLAAWIDKHAQPTFYTVANVREYRLTDADLGRP